MYKAHRRFATYASNQTHRVTFVVFSAATRIMMAGYPELASVFLHDLLIISRRHDGQKRDVISTPCVTISSRWQTLQVVT